MNVHLGAGFVPPPRARAPAQPVSAPQPRAGIPGPGTPRVSGTPPTAPPVPEEPRGFGAPAVAPGFSVAKLSPGDYQQFRLKHLEASLETSLTLTLRTAEGDEVSLDFSQLDTIRRTRISARGADGARVRHSSDSEVSARTVSLAVKGDLSEAERAAIDAVLTQIIDVANGFFGGALGAAMDRLRGMDFDPGTLAEFSLKMTMQRSALVSAGYGGSELPLERLAQRDGEIMKALRFFADEQRALIESAREVLDDASAVRLVRSLLPPLAG